MNRRLAILLALGCSTAFAKEKFKFKENWDADFVEFIDQLNAFLVKFRHIRDQGQWQKVRAAWAKLES